MTSEQIKQSSARAYSEKEWLKEIAYQLAKLNERLDQTLPVNVVNTVRTVNVPG